MAVTIRLSRQGRTHHPVYRITVADQRRATSGKFLSQLGYFNPNTSNPELKVDEEEALSWMLKGAVVTSGVRSLFHRIGLMERLDQARKGKEISETKGTLRPWVQKPSKPSKKQVAKAAKAQAPT